jgi:transglutaminase superfamily protein
LGVQTADRYRTVSETQILDMCHMAGWAGERGEGSPSDIVVRRAIEDWIAMGLGFRRQANGERQFDAVEVLNFVKQAGLDGRDAFWTERFVGTARRLVTDMREQQPRKFVIELQRTFNTQSLPVGTALRLRLPLPLTSSHLGELVINPLVEAADARTAVTRGRLEVRTRASGLASETIGATMAFTACPQEPNLAQAQAQETEFPEGSRELYLRPRAGLIVITERIAALAKSLAGTDFSPLAALHAFWNFCLDELSLGAVHYDQVNMEAPGDWLLDSGWGDCQLFAALFVSMCRACEIPARMLGGFFLYRTYPTNHYWAEAWIDGHGWVPFDFFSWELSRGGQDGNWRDYFFGRIDCRLTNQCLPLDFTGALGVKTPPAWHMLQSATPKGAAVAFVDLDGSLYYSDTVSVLSG